MKKISVEELDELLKSLGADFPLEDDIEKEEETVNFIVEGSKEIKVPTTEQQIRKVGIRFATTHGELRIQNKINKSLKKIDDLVLENGSKSLSQRSIKIIKEEIEKIKYQSKKVGSAENTDTNLTSLIESLENICNVNKIFMSIDETSQTSIHGTQQRLEEALGYTNKIGEPYSDIKTHYEERIADIADEVNCELGDPIEIKEKNEKINEILNKYNDVGSKIASSQRQIDMYYKEIEDAEKRAEELEDQLPDLEVELGKYHQVLKDLGYDVNPLEETELDTLEENNVNALEENDLDIDMELEANGIFNGYVDFVKDFNKSDDNVDRKYLSEGALDLWRVFNTKYAQTDFFRENSDSYYITQTLATFNKYLKSYTEKTEQKPLNKRADSEVDILINIIADRCDELGETYREEDIMSIMESIEDPRIQSAALSDIQKNKIKNIKAQLEKDLQHQKKDPIKPIKKDSQPANLLTDSEKKYLLENYQKSIRTTENLEYLKIISDQITKNYHRFSLEDIIQLEVLIAEQTQNLIVSLSKDTQKDTQIVNEANLVEHYQNRINEAKTIEELDIITQLLEQNFHCMTLAVYADLHEKIVIKEVDLGEVTVQKK